MSSSPQPFYIRKQRSIPEILLDTIRYMAKNANALFLSAGFLALPLILISKAVAAYLTEDATPFNESILHKSELDKTTFIFYCILFGVFVLGLGVYNFILNKFMGLANQLPTTKASADTIRQDFKAAFKEWLPNFVIIFILYDILWQIMHVLSGLQRDYNTSLDPDSDAISYYSQLALPYLPVLAVLPFLLFLLFAGLYLCYRDKSDTSAAATVLRDMTRKYYKKIFLSGAAILLVSFLAYYFLQKLVFLFYSIFSFLSMNMSFYMIFDLMKMAFSFAIIGFMQIAFILLLGSMEDDQESHYIRQQVDQIQS